MKDWCDEFDQGEREDFLYDEKCTQEIWEKENRQTNKVVNMPVMSYPELGRLHDELENVIDKYRGAGIPHASVLGVLVILMDVVMSEAKGDT